MERSGSNTRSITNWFLYSALALLAIGLGFGLIGALQYVVPGLFKSFLSFEQVRPLHVTSVVFWILLAANGCVLTYVQEHTGRGMFSRVMLILQWGFMILAVVAILCSYALGYFGGREYWEGHPALAIPVLAAWICFLINLVLTLGRLRDQPVYVWMWLTGAILFLFTYLESYLWLFPYFRSSIVNDMTIQWKSYGSMVGSWNMLIYGSSMYLLGRISGSHELARSKMAFALYFTGLTNLMFNWGHHLYLVPTPYYIKMISYLISMTELFILGRILWYWKNSLDTAKKYLHLPAYTFVAAADIWIFLTLVLAILMSVPAINVYTHGTHITVAHTMGATIGINTFLLLAMITDILGRNRPQLLVIRKVFRIGFRVTVISLPVFWVSLIVAGILRARWQMYHPEIPFSTMMTHLRPLFIVFMAAGVGIAVGLWSIIYQLIFTDARNQTENEARAPVRDDLTF